MRRRFFFPSNVVFLTLQVDRDTFSGLYLW